MDLAALGAQFKILFGPSDGAIVLCVKEETEVVKLHFTAAPKRDRDKKLFIGRVFKDE